MNQKPAIDDTPLIHISPALAQYGGYGEALALAGRLIHHREVLLKLRSDLELMCKDFEAHDNAREALVMDRERQDRIIDTCLKAAFSTKDQQIIRDTLDSFNRYADATPNYQENALDFVRMRKLG